MSRSYSYRLPDDDGSPSMLSCGLFVLLALFILGTVVFILLKAGALI